MMIRSTLSVAMLVSCGWGIYCSLSLPSWFRPVAITSLILLLLRAAVDIYDDFLDLV
jgi:hypothetical protein